MTSDGDRGVAERIATGVTRPRRAVLLARILPARLPLRTLGGAVRALAGADEQRRQIVAAVDDSARR
jgi:hypothetical protein